MMLSTSLLATLIVGLLWSQWRRFDRRDWALAIGFAVLVDLDHLTQLPGYLATHGGVSGFHAATMLHWGMAWQGALHTWWALLLVIPASFIFRSTLPAVFWLLHMLLDFVVATRFVVWGSATEWILDAVLVVGVLALLRVDHIRRGNGTAFRIHVARALGLVQG